MLSVMKSPQKLFPDSLERFGKVSHEHIINLDIFLQGGTWALQGGSIKLLGVAAGDVPNILHPATHILVLMNEYSASTLRRSQS